MVVHPFNTAAIRMNLASQSADAAIANQSFSTFLRRTIKKDGILSLYNGLSAGLLRQVFYATSRFGLFELFRDEMAKYRPTDFLSRLVTGATAGGCAAFISCPAEVTLVRISNDSTLPLDQRRNYKGVVDAFQRILREEGFKTFFNGSGPFVNRAILVGAVQVGTYDQFRELFKTKLGIKDEMKNVFCASMTSGFIYSVITMPLETTKNRMAFQKPDPVTNILPYRNTTQTILAIIKNEGVLKLWKGFSPYYLRCGGHTVAMFFSIAWLRKNVFVF
jgi:solute carrier family 25 oxoglutarate transporter 11